MSTTYPGRVLDVDLGTGVVASRLLEHEDWRIRLEAARTLGLIRAVDAKAALEARLADKEDLVCKAAQEALRLLP